MIPATRMRPVTAGWLVITRTPQAASDSGQLAVIDLPTRPARSPTQACEQNGTPLSALPLTPSTGRTPLTAVMLEWRNSNPKRSQPRCAASRLQTRNFIRGPRRADSKPRADSRNLPTLKKARFKLLMLECRQPPGADRFQPSTTVEYATAPFGVTAATSTLRYQTRQHWFMTMTCRRATRHRLP